MSGGFGTVTDAEKLVRELLLLLGEDPDREGLLDTPKRMVKALRELTSGRVEEPAEILSTTFTSDQDELVIVRGIPFWSLCEHHVLPFHGTATVGYLPHQRVVGLSKIPRLVHCFAKRLQIQEQLTRQIAESLMSVLQPKGCGVIIEASHTCMQMRGIKSAGEMITSCVLGEFRTDTSLKSEFIRLSKHGLS